MPAHNMRRRSRRPPSILLANAALLLIVITFLFAPPLTGVLAGIAPPEGEKEYSEEFFRQHKKNAPLYAFLVRLFSATTGIVPNGVGDGDDASIRDALKKISVLDVGCGHGLLVEAWRAAGVIDSFCVEGSPNAAPMWPSRYRDDYYVLADLESDGARAKIRRTDYVTSFEVAEHVSPRTADRFVGLLTTHRPRRVFFGAATPFQDRGMNPSHVNENTFGYWIGKFDSVDYIVDWTSTARVKHLLVTQRDPEIGAAISSAWWYPKNMLIFAPKEDRAILDRALLAHPAEADMLFVVASHHLPSFLQLELKLLTIRPPERTIANLGF